MKPTEYLPSNEVANNISERFVHHPPAGDQAGRYTQLRETTRQLALLFVKLAPNSRELSTALTKLDEAVMSVNAAIARNENWVDGVLETQLPTKQ